ncbi:MAG TPA: hypothetical protein VJM32_05125 [Candidatus Saccharimonadales bacterium]|nr:hypothetical protein [Candidatus Saccharimonadales bacterium]
MVATIGLFALAQPARAADTGTIEGGVFIVDVKGSKIKIEDPGNSKVTISPAAAGSQITVNDGRIKITNVPVGTYTVTLAFKFTKDACNKYVAAGSVLGGILTAPIALFCKSSIKDSYYSFNKTWTATVTNGQTTFLEGDSANGDKVIGNAIQTTAAGNPIVDCSGKGILMSFVVCPAIENVLGIIDWIIDNFIQPYLAINPLTPTDAGGGESTLYKVWNNIRNLANIVFIGLFFVIVFSQATSIGISNYGIKKLLPRLVLIAIGTNVSFFICAFLVDVFNILGAGIASLLVTTIIDGSPKIVVGSDLFDALFAAGPLGGMTSLLAQGVLSAAIIFGLFVFLIFAVSILFISAVVVLMRQIIIIFLVIAAPLAFVAGLLPNTQRMFSQWFTTFGRVLAMYPLMMGLVAAGKIASTILSKLGQ